MNNNETTFEKDPKVIRDDIKYKLSANNYKTLADQVRDFIQKSFKTQIPFSSDIILILLITMISCVGFLASYLLQKTSFGYHFSSGKFSQNQIILQQSAIFISAYYILFVLLITDNYIKYMFKVCQFILLDSLERATDLEDFKKWLEKTFSFREQFIWSLFFSVLVHISAFVSNQSFFSTFGLGIIISNFILNVLYGYFFYVFINFIIFISKNLIEYQFKLDDDNPQDSPIIYSLNSALILGVYINIIISICLNILFFVFQNYANFKMLPIYSFPLITAIIWLFNITLFISIYYSMTKIIAKKKELIMRKIRDKIKRLKIKLYDNDANDEEIVEGIKRLIE